MNLNKIREGDQEIISKESGVRSKVTSVDLYPNIDKVELEKMPSSYFMSRS